MGRGCGLSDDDGSVVEVATSVTGPDTRQTEVGESRQEKSILGVSAGCGVMCQPPGDQRRE